MKIVAALWKGYPSIDRRSNGAPMITNITFPNRSSVALQEFIESMISYWLLHDASILPNSDSWFSAWIRS
jgi:hypothetical protein